MSHFSLNNNSSSFLSSINALGNDYYPRSFKYPSGKVVIENTSFGKEGVSGRTLTSRTASDAITAAGDIAYRSPLYSTKFTQEMLNSSSNSFFTSGAQVAYGTSYLKVVDEDSPSFRTEKDGKSQTGYSTVSGGLAFNRLMGNSIAGRAGGQDFVNRAIREIEGESITSSGSGDGDSIDDADDSADASVGSGPIRPIISDSTFAPGEKAWLIERAQMLYNKGPGHPVGSDLNGVVTDRGNGLVSGFTYDLPNGMTGLKYYLGSRYPGYSGDNALSIDQSEIDAGPIKAYVYPAMIELLLYLSDKIIIQGGFGFHRANLQQIENNALAAEAENVQYSSARFRVKTDSSIPAHARGSAFDIDLIGKKDQSVVINLNVDGRNVDKHREAVLIFFEALNSAPMHLIPDFIKFHDGLGAEYGISKEEFELETSPLKTAYNRLKYVNFSVASDHRTHIHMDFSSKRSGQYVASGTLGTSVGVDSSIDPPTTPDPNTGAVYIPGLGTFLPTVNFNNPKFTQLHKTYPMQLLANEIYSLMSNICCPELAAIMTAISQREGNVSSLNVGLTESGDWSYGFLQNNLYGGHGKVEVLVPYPTPTVIHAWKLAAPGWQFFGLQSWEQWKGLALTVHNSMDLTAFEKNQRDGSDDRLWYPLNQAYMAYRFMCGQMPTYPLPENGKLGLRPQEQAGNGKMQHVLTPWGDYGGVPGGPLYGVKWTDAKAVYLANNPSKTEDNLKTWIRNYFSTADNGATSKSAPKIEDWLAGKRILRNGTIRDTWD